MLPVFLQLCSQINVAFHDLACMTWRWQRSDVARSSALHLLLMLSYLWKVCGWKCTRSSQITCCITVPRIVTNAVAMTTKLMFPSKICKLSWSRQQEFERGFNWITKERRNEKERELREGKLSHSVLILGSQRKGTFFSIPIFPVATVRLTQLPARMGESTMH